MNSSRVLSRWSWAAILIIGLAALYTDLSRYVVPVGEKYVMEMPPGSADFTNVYNGARAFLDGVNPYHHLRHEFDDPWQREDPNDIRSFKQNYPISHILLYVPLAWVIGDHPHGAAKVWFHLNLVFLGLLAIGLGQVIASRFGFGRELKLGLMFYFLTVLALHTGTTLGLERGQSDIFSAVLCWSATYLAWKNRAFLSMFLVGIAVLIKGYALILALGLGLIFIERKRAKAAVGGSLLAILILFAPGIHFWRDSIEGLQSRNSIFEIAWFNHSFKSLVYYFSPDHPEMAEMGRKVLTLFALSVASLCWWMARTSKRAAFWLVAFTTSALAAIIGYSAFSADYNLILIMPGFLILVFCYPDFLPTQKFTNLSGLALLMIAYALWVPAIHSQTFSTAGWGMLGLLTFLGAVATLNLRSSECSDR